MPNYKNKEYLRLVIRGFIAFLLTIVLFFILAGRINYWQGWVYAVTNVIILLISSTAFANKADLVKERLKPGPGIKWWDKILFYWLYTPIFFAVFIIACLDAGRFRWTTELPVSIYVVSYLVYFFSQFLHHWAMWVNPFYSSVIRIQKERGHEVIQSGPYHFVRHPGYVAGILMAVSSSLIFGSLWALNPAGMVVILLIVRTYLEDVTLQRELSGYADYTRKVKCRLLPGVW